MIRLTADTPIALERIGGKAVGLVRLMRAGFDVPEAWCIPVGGVEEDELRRFWAEHSAWRFAVRSSATAEDLAESSFAGIYTTVLGVDSADALVEAVHTCREAFDGEHAVAYRLRREFTNAGGLALVVQRLLSPEVAGVMMTENPQRPFADEVVVDAVFGLGEGMVSGRVEPDHVVLTREGAVVERGERRCLDDDQLAALMRVARAVEPRSDLEWAFEGGRLFLLQQRPMTNLPPRLPRVVCARGFGDEYLAGYTMPLTRTLLVRWIREVAFHDLARLMGRDDLLALEPIVAHQGYHYMNGDYAIRLLRAVPRFAREAGPLAWFSPAYQERLREGDFDPRAMLGFALAPLRDRGAPIHRNVAELEEHCLRIERVIVPKLAQDYAALLPHEWQAQLDEVDVFGREHFRIIRWGMTVWGPLLHGALREGLAWACADDGALYQALVGGLSGTRTAEINRDIHALGRVAAAHGLESEELAADLERFLARHGHRAPSREITEPRWRETPEVVLALVRAQFGRTHDAPTPEQLEAAATERRHAAEREVSARVHNPLVRRALRTLVDLTRDYTRYRENQRYHLDYVLTHCRALILEQGRRLVSRGVLSHVDDVFLLEAHELGEGAAAGVLDERRAHHLTHRNRLPATYLFDGVETEGEVAEGPRGHSRDAGEGHGASRGHARGPVRVVRDAGSLGAVWAGEILVVSTIDPAWTSVFPLVAGLITETGGTLSHGALLAREYGIPAVAGVKKATERFVDGELVEIDGASGVVRRVSGDDAHGSTSRSG